LIEGFGKGAGVPGERCGGKKKKHSAGPAARAMTEKGGQGAAGFHPAGKGVSFFRGKGRWPF